MSARASATIAANWSGVVFRMIISARRSMSFGGWVSAAAPLSAQNPRREPVVLCQHSSGLRARRPQNTAHRWHSLTRSPLA